MAISLRGVEELIPQEDWLQKLAKSEANGVPLRIKLGLDPTAPDIHVGHTVVLNKMRQLQDLGHQVIFLIGDFTSLIGDPSGRNTTRPPLTAEQIKSNAETYYKQASLVLDPARTEIRYNSEWSDPLGARGMIQLAARYTVARMMERDDFNKRFREGQSISVHEFLYPLMQGYDSVALKSDLELGGTDQKFNLLMGRHLQQEYGQEPQCILTMPLLEGLDGVEKMSKSKGNYIGITEDANTMFAKVMSISDTLMWRWYTLLSFRSAGEIDQLKQEVEGGQERHEVLASHVGPPVARRSQVGILDMRRVCHGAPCLADPSEASSSPPDHDIGQFQEAQASRAAVRRVVASMTYWIFWRWMASFSTLPWSGRPLQSAASARTNSTRATVATPSQWPHRSAEHSERTDGQQGGRRDQRARTRSAACPRRARSASAAWSRTG